MLTSCVRLLTFGDSLTAGMSTRDAAYTPYARSMQDSLEQLGTAATVVPRGVVMESVHTMPARLRSELKAASYEGILILGGSNDLWKNDVDAIWESLQALHAIARAHLAARQLSGHASLGLLTLPPFRPAPMRWFGGERDTVTRLTDLTRRKVNQRIRRAARAVDDAFCIDLAALCEERPDLYVEDRIHLTASAYELLGSAAAAAWCEAQREPALVDAVSDS